MKIRMTETQVFIAWITTTLAMLWAGDAVMTPENKHVVDMVVGIILFSLVFVLIFVLSRYPKPRRKQSALRQRLVEKMDRFFKWIM